jgi:hypothetical protein
MLAWRRDAPEASHALEERAAWPPVDLVPQVRGNAAQRALLSLSKLEASNMRKVVTYATSHLSGSPATITRPGCFGAQGCLQPGSGGPDPVLQRASEHVTRWLVSCAALGLVLSAALWQLASAQSTPARVLISAPPDSGQLVRLAGNTRPEVNAGNDRGRVPDMLAMEHMQLLLKRPAERESALKQYIEQLNDPHSPSFHHWLTPSDLTQRFGLAQQDIDAVTTWLTQQGFKVNAVHPDTLIIDFSGTAGEVRKAFHTQIHYLDVRGQRHIANMSDPEIPAALAPAVAGIVSLHDFPAHPLVKPHARHSTPLDSAARSAG